MKKLISIFLCLLVLMAAAGCAKSPAEQSDPCDLRTGNYYMKGYEEITMAPYVNLDFNDYSIEIRENSLDSKVEKGSFIVKDKNLIATTSSAVYEFQIVGEKIILLLKTSGQPAQYMLSHSIFSYTELGS